MPESRPETIAAVVVTYNRKQWLGECLDSLLRQSRPLDALYVVDNHSTDGTCDSLLAGELIGPIPETGGEPAEVQRSVVPPPFPERRVDVHYVRMPENTGGAGGFHEGLKRAAEAGFDWFWLMDDDLWTSPDALEWLVRKKEALQGIQGDSFVLNSLVLAKVEGNQDELAFPLQEISPRGAPKIGVYYHRLSEVRHRARDGLYEWACPFNGTFLPARVVREIGLPNKEFFIWGDERDFLWRTVKSFRPYTVLDSKVYHPLPRAGTFDWRQYYFIRNALFVNRHLNLTALRNLKLILTSLARGVRHGRPALRLVLRALRDGLAGRLGKREDLHP